MVVITVVENEDCETYTLWIGGEKVGVCASYLEDEMRDSLIKNGSISKYTKCVFKYA